jgi:hypothetical protein
MLSALRAWVKKETEHATGLLYGMTVVEPLDAQTKKSYNFLFENEKFSFHMIAWESGEVFITAGTFVDGASTPDDGAVYNESFEFYDAEALVNGLEALIKTYIPRVDLRYSSCLGRNAA